MLEIIGDAVASGGAAALASEVIAARKSQADSVPGEEDTGDGVAADDASDEAVAPEAAAAPEAAGAAAEAAAEAEVMEVHEASPEL